MSAIKSEKRRCPNGHYSSLLDQDPAAESLHSDALDLSGHGHGCEEQMVPASMAFQAYRYSLILLNKTLSVTLFRLAFFFSNVM